MSSPAVSTGRPELLGFIRTEIANQGPMTFARFMELALYHPHWGYYTTVAPPQRIGRKGDYFTNVSVGALFGELLGVQFADMWERMGRPASFELVELGSHRGQLAADIRTWVRQDRPDFNAALHMTVLDYPGDLPQAVTGCIFSNELVDALPVHIITRQEGKWLEQHVVSVDDGFQFAPQPLSSADLRQAIAVLPLPTVDGYTTEVHMEAGRWMERTARCLHRGYLLTIDYGYIAEDYYAPHRKNGTLLCYHHHRSNDSPLLRVGEQDITAHVNFSILARRGTEAGLSQPVFCDQTQFTGALVETSVRQQIIPATASRLSQLKTLLHPELMGGVFKVLVQHRSVDHTPLAGFKYARGGIV